MASSSTSVAHTFIFFSLLISLSSLLPLASPDFLAPLLAPVLDDICKGVGCGRGKCKISENSGSLYECECDPGWKQFFSSNASAVKYLPCVIPNCTLDMSCSEATPPAQSKETPGNLSILEPCYWANCGGGVCNKTSELTYNCECKERYYNLLNNTAFPCLRQCSIGGDCPNLGITLSNKSTAPTPNLADTGTNQAHSLQLEIFYAAIGLVMAGALL